MEPAAPAGQAAAAASAAQLGTAPIEGALAALPAAKRELARLLLAARQSVPGRPGTRSGGGPVLATALQTRLWRREYAHTGMGTGSHAVRLKGPLDPARLRDALTGVLRRHEALRTRLVPGTGTVEGPQLVVDDEPCLRLTQTDLSGYEPQTRADRVARQITESAGTVLNLESGRTSWFRLLLLAPDEHVLILTSHLAVFDGWSSGVFLTDLAAGYRDGGDSLAPPELQFPDYADWQRRWLAGPDGVAELTRRRAVFAADPPAPRAPGGFERGHLPVRLARGPVDAGLALGAAEGATPFMTLLTALAVVLARREGRTDAVIGTPAAGRFSGQLEGAVGQFTTVVPIRIDLAGEPSFRELLHRTRTAVADALSHQRLPVDALFGDGDPPPYNVLFALHNYPAVPFDLPGIEVSQLPGPPARHLELYSPDPAATLACVGLVERDGEIGGTAEYNRRAATPEDVRGLLTGIEEVLDRAVAAPASPTITQH
ncbi:condensation domain-containing protein [Streptomyces sp. A3M-1-3]|uniref:condensation domain-containing protein n=1 Tax=Streptomyces sp. A3M-1-3 TaxID=2962044 RepID=UPI0020B6E1A0|nr:condensation domain-containing protein [Streptomyces sp. A3M-1-3]MCP3820590.1 condensation domain-containing protein [Streptomyces sp. A3M-1-3]